MTVYILQAISSFPSLLQSYFLTDKRLLNTLSLWPVLLGGCLYIVGALIYANRWPEKFAVKGRYDMIGNSHNIFHALIVIAALIHWYGSIRVFHERQLYPCPS